MEELVKYIVLNLVEFPEDVVITLEKKERETAINIKTNESDLGKIIGKNGNIINSIRNLVRALSTKEDGRIFVKVG